MEASDWFSESCLKDGDDCFNVMGKYFRGLAFYKGLCGPVNYKEAAKWFTKAAEHEEDCYWDLDSSRDLRSCKYSAWYYLGVMYYYGQGVDVDYDKALRWLRMAVDESNEGYAVIGDAYREGHGVEQNYGAAEECYSKAPVAYAKKRLGDMYRDGIGVKQNYREALKHYQQAAEWGSADAQDCLADMYRNGQGVAKDPAEAMKWYMKAAQNGSAEAKRKIMEMMGGFAQSGISPDSAQKEITD